MPNYFRNPDALVDAVRAVLSGQPVEEKMDPVDPKALKGKHKDRKDKDIDNDGNVDSSDEYLHNRRQAISKAMKEEVELDEGMFNYPDMAKHLVKRYGKNITKKHIDSLQNDLDTHQSIDRNELKHHIKKYGGTVKEEVELDEAVKIGDTVTVKLNRKGREYIEKGKVIKIEKDSIIVKHDFSRTPSRVSMKNIVKEEVEIDEDYGAMLAAKAHAKKDGKNYDGDVSVQHKYDAYHMKKRGYTHFEPGRYGNRRYTKGYTGGNSTKITSDHHSGVSESVEIDEEDIIQKYRDEVSKLEAKKNKTSYEIGRLKMMKQRLRKIDEEVDLEDILKLAGRSDVLSMARNTNMIGESQQTAAEKVAVELKLKPTKEKNKIIFTPHSRLQFSMSEKSINKILDVLKRNGFVVKKRRDKGGNPEYLATHSDGSHVRYSRWEKGGLEVETPNQFNNAKGRAIGFSEVPKGTELIYRPSPNDEYKVTYIKKKGDGDKALIDAGYTRPITVSAWNLFRMSESKMYGVEEKFEDNPANSQHLCAKNVVHEQWGEGVCIPTMHADPDAEGNVAWYDIMFEHGIETRVSIEELKVIKAESHMHSSKKKKMKESKEEVELDEAFNIDLGAKVAIKKNGKLFYGKVIGKEKVMGKPGVEVQWSSGQKGRFPMSSFAGLSMDKKADYVVSEAKNAKVDDVEDDKVNLKKKGKGKKDEIDTEPNMDDQKMTAEMSDKQMKKREEIVKSMKKKSGDFKKRYGDRAKDVMYATATKMAMKEGFELGIEKSEFIEEVNDKHIETWTTERSSVGKGDPIRIRTAHILKTPNGKFKIVRKDTSGNPRVFGTIGGYDDIEDARSFIKKKMGSLSKMKESQDKDLHDEVELDEAMDTFTVKYKSRAGKEGQIKIKARDDNEAKAKARRQINNLANINSVVKHAEITKPPFDGPYRKASEPRKDKFGNVIKTQNVAKHLAKAAAKKAAEK